jgi:NAD(P)-dependent dehydrogenase (short-subunit alcohol dehydrogenase family)
VAHKLEGKSAVVTGSGSGIGRAVALDMAAEGAKVVVNDIGSQSDGKRAADLVVEEIKKANGVAIASYDNIATMTGGDNAIKTAVDNFGRIDIVVNCAGNFPMAKTVADLSEDDWDSTMNVHLKGHFSTIRAAIPKMIQQGTGRIINISSGAAFQTGRAFLTPPPFSFAAYGAAKAGILGLTTTLSLELKEYGITVNAIIPSAVTSLFPGQRQRFFGGPTEGPEFVSPMLVYLATDGAKDITGQFIYACAGDFCIFTQPFQLPGEHIFVRKMDKWTIDELDEMMPALLGL